MAHIVVDAREWSTSTGRYIRSVLRGIDAIDTAAPLGHRFTVVVQPKDLADATFASPSLTAVPGDFPQFSVQEQVGLKRLLDRLRPDLVHFGMTQQPLLYRGSPVVTTMHDLTTLRYLNPAKNAAVMRVKRLAYRAVIRHAARHSAAVIVPSRFVARDVARHTGLPEDRFTVTYEAADPIPDAPEPVEGLIDRRFLLFVGYPGPHKNLDRLIEAWVELKATHPDLLLVLAGKADPKYQALRDRHAHLDGLVFTGYVSEGALRWLYEHCTAYVFPSESEGFGLPGLEAMRHGAPVASSAATALPEVYGKAAEYFDPLDVADMARVLRAVVEEPWVRDRLVLAGRRRAAEFSWRRTAEQTLEVYESVLRQARESAEPR